MSNNFQCPFCSALVPIIPSTYKTEPVTSRLKLIKIPECHGSVTTYTYDYVDNIEMHFYYCPSCEKITITGKGTGSQFEDRLWSIFPDSLAKKFPDYVPTAIITDYDEACKIVNLSPKASATLSRRCIQGMIRDFWGVSKNSLLDEIKSIENKVDSDTREVLHALRQLGNIGAHPERDINLLVDIEPDEASQLILFIEYLIEEWYVKRHDRKSMLSRITGINSNKQDQRKS